MTPTEENQQCQVKFVTKHEQYSVPDTTFALDATATEKELNSLIQGLLSESGTECKAEFEFLLGGKILNDSIGSHVTSVGLCLESVLEIEYIERLPSPEADECIVTEDWVSSIHASNNWILAGSYDGSVQLWTTTGKHQMTMKMHTKPVKGVTWMSLDNDSGVFVSVSNDQNALLWNWDLTENVVTPTVTFKGHAESIDCVAAAPDHTRFATGGWDFFLKIWSISEDDSDVESKKAKSNSSHRTKAPLVTLKGHKGAISSLVWIDNIELLTSSWDHTMRLWDTEMSSSVREISTTKAISSIDYSHLSGLICTGSKDRTLRLYDLRIKEGQICKKTLTSHKKWVTSVNWSKTDKNLLISGSQDQTVKLWDIRSPDVPLYDMSGHTQAVLCTDWSIPALIISGGADNNINIFKV